MLQHKIIGCFAMALALASSNAFASKSIEANLSNDSAQIEFDAQAAGTNNIFLNASFLYSEEYDHHSSLVGTIGIQGVETDNATYRAAVGARLYAYDFDKINGSALAVGGQFYHVIPGLQRFSAGGYGWYAPKVTSFGNTEGIYEFGGRVAFRVIQNTDIFVGYRYLNVKHKKGFNDPLEKGLNLGFRLNF